MAALLKSLCFMFNISFLPKYRVKYYDYMVKVVEWDIAGYFIHFSLVADNMPL